MGILLLVLAVTEPVSGISFDVPKATPCVVIPKGKAREGCPTPDAAIVKKELGDAWLYAMSEDTTVILIARNVDVEGAQSMTEETLDQFVDGVAKGDTAANFVPVMHGRHKHTTKTYAGTKVAEFVLGSETIQLHGAVIPIEGQVIGLIETGTKADGTALHELLTNMKVPATLESAKPAFGKDKAFVAGEAAGRVVGTVCGLACCPITIGLIIWLVLRNRKKNAAPPAA